MVAKKKKKNASQWKMAVALVLLAVAGLFVFPTTRTPMIRFVWEMRSSFDLSTNYIFGIDVSHYQEKINWKKVKVSRHPIRYVFIRATMGAERKDTEFANNWQMVKEQGFLRGAYHYYDPRQNSTLQAENFIRTVSLSSGDFPPVLDIEEASPFGNDNLRKGIKNWLTIVEKHYGVKPIIYTGLKFHEDYLDGEIDPYPLWIAAYDFPKERMRHLRWSFHQFTDKVNVYGIATRVDGNDFNGTEEELQQLLIP